MKLTFFKKINNSIFFFHLFFKEETQFSIFFVALSLLPHCNVVHILWFHSIFFRYFYAYKILQVYLRVQFECVSELTQIDSDINLAERHDNEVVANHVRLT